MSTAGQAFDSMLGCPRVAVLHRLVHMHLIRRAVSEHSSNEPMVPPRFAPPECAGWPRSKDETLLRVSTHTDTALMDSNYRDTVTVYVMDDKKMLCAYVALCILTLRLFASSCDSSMLFHTSRELRSWVGASGTGF